jgi:hypothetical protein
MARYRLANRLRELKLSHDKATDAIHDLAASLGIKDLNLSRPLLTRWVQGNANPGPEYVFLLCLLCDRAPAEIDLAKGWRLPFDPRHAALTAVHGRPSLASLPPGTSPAQAGTIPSDEHQAPVGPVILSDRAGMPATIPPVVLPDTPTADDSIVAIPIRGPQGIVTYMISRRTFLTFASLAGIAPMAMSYNTHGNDSRSEPHPPSSWADSVRQAVLDPTSIDVEDYDSSADLTPLSSDVRDAIRMSLASNHSRLQAVLPRLIGRAERLLAEIRNDDTKQTALRLAADVYAVAGWTLIKGDDPMFAVVAAERSIGAARRADDSLRVSAATRCLAEAHMRDGRFDTASRIALNASLPVSVMSDRDTPAALNLRGAALLSAAAAAARRHDGREAHDALAAAAACAAQLGEDRYDFGAVFGPTNIAIHRVAIAIELGNADEAVRRSHEVNLTPLPSHLRERRARYFIDLARAHTQLKHHSEALYALRSAETVAPDETRSHRLTRFVLHQMLSASAVMPKHEVESLAARCGVVH